MKKQNSLWIIFHLSNSVEMLSPPVMEKRVIHLGFRQHFLFLRILIFWPQSAIKIKLSSFVSIVLCVCVWNTITQKWHFDPMSKMEVAHTQSNTRVSYFHRSPKYNTILFYICGWWKWNYRYNGIKHNWKHSLNRLQHYTECTDTYTRHMCVLECNVHSFNRLLSFAINF